MAFRIHVSKSAGFMPPASGYLKENGEIWTTDDKAEAKAKAEDYRQSMNTIYSTALFSASVEEF